MLPWITQQASIYSLQESIITKNWNAMIVTNLTKKIHLKAKILIETLNIVFFQCCNENITCWYEILIGVQKRIHVTCSVQGGVVKDPANVKYLSVSCGRNSWKYFQKLYDICGFAVYCMLNNASVKLNRSLCRLLACKIFCMKYAYLVIIRIERISTYVYKNAEHNQSILLLLIFTCGFLETSVF